MTPSQARDIAIGNARFLTERASIHIDHGRYSRAFDCLRSATGIPMEELRPDLFKSAAATSERAA